MSAPSSASVRYAGFWIRVVAAIIDTLLSAIILVPILWMVFGREYFSSDEMIQGPVDFLLTWVAPAVAVILFWIYRSATPGKMAIDASIVDAKTLGRPSKGQLVVRYLGYYVSLIPLGLGILWIAFDSRKQGFHDKLARTVVIRRT